MDEQSTVAAPAGLLRRLAAVFYDLLLIFALVVALTFALLPLTGGVALLTSTQGWLGRLYHALQLLLAFSYFGICWTRGGQTLGMKAWRIRLESVGGQPPNWADVFVRFTIGTTLLLLAVCGIWYLLIPGPSLDQLAAGLLLLPTTLNLGWIPFERAGRSLQDLAGAMRVVRTTP